MRTRLLPLVLFSLLGLVVVSGAVSAGSATSPPAWGQAIEVPGTDALNTGGNADLTSVSCSSTGNCSGGGSYIDDNGLQQAFVDDETNGTWGTAIEVPGVDALNLAGDASVESISCTAAGSCTAGGYYYDGVGFEQAFVVDETSGSWGTAIKVPGMDTLDPGDARVNAVSCATAGNCVAGGYYHDSSHVLQAWVADETDGTWGNAIEVPGTATLNSSGAAVRSVSCATAGNCAAGGVYNQGSGHAQSFVADETDGAWGNAIEVPGTAALNFGPGSVRSISCAATGDCTAGGYYADASGHTQAFVADETSSTWGTAIEVPGTATLNHGGDARVTSVSCSSAGNCAGAGHYYAGGSGDEEAFVVDETNGTWGTAIEVPGIGTLNNGGAAEVESVSCTAAGECDAGGFYTDGSDLEQAFVIDETDGAWHNAIEVPGTATLNDGGIAIVNSISCATANDCAAGGEYSDDQGAAQTFVVSSVAVGVTTLAPASAGGIYGGTATLSATLTSAGNFVPNETVSFTLNGTNVGSATTDGNGVATLENVSLTGIAVGSYSTAVAASFDGNGNPESASNGSSSLTVYPAAEIVGLNGVSVKTTGGKIDSYDSSAGAYGSSNHGSAALVLSNAPVSFAGVVLSGGATSTQGGVSVAKSASVSGNVTAGGTASVRGK